LVETLLELRRRARDTHDYPMADLIRDRLNHAGVEVRDAEEGSTWSLGQNVGR
jgi:cysteinyl-tRNA synthetase